MSFAEAEVYSSVPAHCPTHHRPPLRHARRLTRTTLSAVDTFSLSLDSESTLRASLRGATFSYPSILSATLCNCALSLGAATLPLTLSGGSCAPLSKEAPRLDVGAAAAPDGVLAAALLSARGGASVACTASVLGGAFSRRIEVPLGGHAGGAPAAAGGAPAASSGAPAAPAPAAPPPPSLAPALSGFESASSTLVFDAAQFRASLPFPLGALHVTAPGATLVVEEGGGGGGGSATVVASATLLPVSIHDDGAAPAAPASTQALLVFASSPARALSSVAPGLTLSAVAAATGLPAEALVALLGVAGVRVPATMAGAAAAAPASGEATFTLRGRALPLGADGAAVAAAVAGLIGGAAAPPPAPAAGCALDAAPLPWLRAALSGPSAPPCIDDTLLVARVAASSAAAAAAAPLRRLAAAAPTVTIVLSAPGAGVDLSVPRAGVGATLSLGDASFLARGLYTLLQPYVGVYASPVSVDTHIPTAWRAATPAAGGAWNVGPARASSLWASTACGRASVALAWEGGALTASAVAELPNAVGCVRAVLREYMLGPFASTPTGETLIRDAATLSPPKGALRLVLPSLGELTLPLGVSARSWLAGDLGATPTKAENVLTRPPHTASLWPGMFVVTEKAEEGLARAVGFTSHSGEDAAAIAAGVAAGCALGVGSAELCAAWNARWRDAGFLGVDGLLLAGECPAGSDSLRVCVSVTLAPDVSGLLGFNSMAPQSYTLGDLVDAIAASAKPHSGVAPARFTLPRNQWAAIDWSYLAGWELVPLQGDATRFQGVSLTGALLYGNLTVSSAHDGSAEGWLGSGYRFSLPRVPSSCARPLPSRIAGAPPSTTLGFNTLTSEACTRPALQPMLDLVIDLFVKYISPQMLPSPRDGNIFSWIAWAPRALYYFFGIAFVQSAYIFAAVTEVSAPSWALSGMAIAGSVIQTGSLYLIGLLTGFLPLSAAVGTIVPALPSAYDLLVSNLAIAGLSIHAVVSLQNSFLVDLSFTNNTWNSSINSAESAWGVAK